MNELPKLMDVESAAEYLRVSTKTVYDLISKRKLKAVKIGQHWMMREQDVAQYVDSLFTA